MSQSTSSGPPIPPIPASKEVPEIVVKHGVSLVYYTIEAKRYVGRVEGEIETASGPHLKLHHVGMVNGVAVDQTEAILRSLCKLAGANEAITAKPPGY